jgi:hypothetical protein
MAGWAAMADSARPHWWATLPPAETEIACGDGRHVVRWENGALTLPAHADTEAELILAALGGDKPKCVELAELWARHRDDLDILATGPRWDGDEIPVSWDDVEAARSGRPVSALRPRSVPMRPAVPGLGPLPQPGGPGAFATRSEIMRARTRQTELLTLLALGPAFQMRLSASVAAAWQDRPRAGPGAERRAPPERPGRPEPEAMLVAALTGRFAVAVESWLGIAADLVTARLHDGPGWGEVELTSPSAGSWRRSGHGLRASLPVSWLARVWAPGLALVGRHLVVAMLEAGWPDARVLALAAPGADPVALAVRATGGPGNTSGGAHWEITDTGEEAGS